jgi:hypothetical protein
MSLLLLLLLSKPFFTQRVRHEMSHRAEKNLCLYVEKRPKSRFCYPYTPLNLARGLQLPQVG